MNPLLARRSAALWVALLAALLASCARDLPTAPHSEREGNRRPESAHHIGDEVAVTLVVGADAEDLASCYGATVLAWDRGGRVAAFLPGEDEEAPSLAARLSTDPRVSTSEPNSEVQPAESRQKSFAFDDGRNTPDEAQAQPALEAVRALQGHAVSRGNGTRIAVLDTGIDPSHPLFAGRIAASYDFIENRPGAAEIAEGLDTNGDGFTDGAFGHGSHVAGVITMVAPGARLLVGRVLDSDGIGDVCRVAAGIRWADAQGADVINLSLGSLARSEAIAEAIEDAERHGIVVVSSAGNWGSAEPEEYPARSSRVIAVAACDADASPAPWTSYAHFVALSAPGVAIRSAYPGGIYRQWSGTSMAAALVSGASALLLAKHPSWERDEVCERLGGFAAPLTHVAPEQVGLLGAGMLDVGAALAPDAPAGDEGSIDTPGGLR